MEDACFSYIEALDEEHLEGDNNNVIVDYLGQGLAICDQCGKGFSNIYTLSAHKKQVHEGIKSHRCHMCEAAFATKYKLKRHHAGVHSEERNFHCETCLGSFKTRDMLKKHERSHFQGKGPFQCDICAEVFKFKSGYDYHHKMRHEVKPLPEASKSSFICPECNKIFTTKKALDRHKDHHKVKDKLKCAEPECYKLFSTVKDQQRHVKLIHTNFVFYNCSYCQKQYKSKANFEIHIASHERNNEMDDYEYVTEPNVLKEVIIEEVYGNDDESIAEDAVLESSHEQYNDEKEVNIEDLLKNIDSEMVSIVKIETEVLEEPIEDPVGEVNLEMEDEPPIIRMEPPEGIGYGMEDDEDYMIAEDLEADFYETIIAEELEPPPLSDDDMIIKVENLNFPKSITDADSLPRITVHRPRRGEAMSICDECGSTFKNNSHLKRHVMRKHRKDQYKMECDICGQKFLLNYDLRRHMIKHSNIRDYKCEECSQKFKTELSLKNHIKVVHNKQGEQSRNFPCLHCERSYLHKRHLEYHMRKHTGDQRFRCDLCVPEKTFHYSDAIKWHKIRHHGEAAPWNCSICAKKFIHEKSLNTHEKEHQPNTLSLSVTCPECGKSVSEKRHLKRHMRTHSTKEFHCCCGESFKERHQLTKHKQSCKGVVDDNSDINEDHFIIATLT